VDEAIAIAVDVEDPLQLGALGPGGHGAPAALALPTLGLGLLGTLALPRLEQEALSLLDDVALADQLAKGALERGLMSGVQPRQPQEFFDPQRVVGVCEDLLELLR
jgi:hypothetical protein